VGIVGIRRNQTSRRLDILTVLQRLVFRLQRDELPRTLGVMRPARVGARNPGIVPIVLEMPNNTPACLQQRSNTRDMTKQQDCVPRTSALNMTRVRARTRAAAAAYWSISAVRARPQNPDKFRYDQSILTDLLDRRIYSGPIKKVHGTNANVSILRCRDVLIFQLSCRIFRLTYCNFIFRILC